MDNLMSIPIDSLSPVPPRQMTSPGITVCCGTLSIKADLPVAQDTGCSAVQQPLHCPTHLELMLICLPPCLPCLSGQRAYWQLRNLRNNLLLLYSIRDMLPPAGKGLSQDPVQHALDACYNLGPVMSSQTCERKCSSSSSEEDAPGCASSAAKDELIRGEDVCSDALACVSMGQ